MGYKHNLTDADLNVILRHYDGKTETINKIMALLNHRFPRWYIRRIAACNGLAREGHNRPWSQEETEYLEKHYETKSIDFICKKLKRSRTAVFVKSRRLGISKHNGAGFTMQEVCSILGCDHHKVRTWIESGKLRDSRKNTERVPEQGGDMWHIKPADIREMVIDYWQEIDIRRVDKFYFIQLLAGRL